MNFLPLPDGGYLLGGRRAARTSEIAKFSASDAERYDDYCAQLDVVADVLRDLVLKAPPNVVQGFGSARIAASWCAPRLSATDLRKLDLEAQRLLLDLFTKSAADFLSDWFES